MKSRFTFAVIAVLACAAFAQNVPTFKLASTSGKSFTQADLKGKPTLLVFLKAGCPHNPKSMPDFTRLSKQVAGKMNLVLVTNITQSEAKPYAKEIKSSLPLVSDPNRVLIKLAGAKHSLDMGLVSSDGKKIVATYEGYSKQVLAQVLADVVASGGPKLNLDLSKYPSSLQSGCSF
ncbi:MAG: redoxin domain-containing protein [Armatimonadetes bacterium]|nr:redoxin domain-containing protein [Armatimonadota bacterium]